MSPFLDSLSALDNPLLPTPIGVQVALRLSWALVLGSLSWLLAGRLACVYRLSLLVLVAVWTCLPGSLSPAYWLGLAFQTPSLMSSVLCGAWLFVGVVRRRTTANATAAWAGDSLSLLCLAGIVGGWVLLLDTLAWWPVSIYALGFSPAALGGVALCAAALWVVQGRDGLKGFLLLTSVLTLFVLSRLTTGNLWDALLDPWLWVALQFSWLLGVVRSWRRTQRPAQAIRA